MRGVDFEDTYDSKKSLLLVNTSHNLSFLMACNLHLAPVLVVVLPSLE